MWFGGYERQPQYVPVRSENFAKRNEDGLKCAILTLTKLYDTTQFEVNYDCRQFVQRLHKVYNGKT